MKEIDFFIRFFLPCHPTSPLRLKEMEKTLLFVNITFSRVDSRDKKECLQGKIFNTFDLFSLVSAINPG